jgi:hypothetical protein
MPAFGVYDGQCSVSRQLAVDEVDEEPPEAAAQMRLVHGWGMENEKQHQGTGIIADQGREAEGRGSRTSGLQMPRSRERYTSSGGRYRPALSHPQQRSASGEVQRWPLPLRLFLPSSQSPFYSILLCLNPQWLSFTRARCIGSLSLTERQPKCVHTHTWAASDTHS